MALRKGEGQTECFQECGGYDHGLGFTFPRAARSCSGNFSFILAAPYQDLESGFDPGYVSVCESSMPF